MTTISFKNMLLAGLSGLMLTAGFAPINLDWMAWISLLPLLMSLEAKSQSDAFKIGLITGLFHYLTLIYWIIIVISHYGNMSLVFSLSALLLLSFYLSLYMAFFSLLTVKLKKNSLYSLWGACIWVALEYARSHIMTGFPWCLLGYSQFFRLPLIQISDITGVYGVSFLIVWVNFALYHLIFFLIKNKMRAYAIGYKQQATNSYNTHHNGQWTMDNGHASRIITIEIILTSFIIGFTLFYGNNKLNEDTKNNGKKARTVIVQGNIDQSLKWNADYQEETLSIYHNLSIESADFEPHLIIWPETALPAYFQDTSPLSQKIFAVAEITHADVLFGSPAYIKNKDTIVYYNRAYVISSHEVFDYYDKVHLVPFGEYVPLKRYIPFVHRVVPAVGDFSGGKKVKPLHTPDLTIGALICFEGIFPDISRKLAIQGAELLVNITNDAWFGRTSAPYQHLSMAVFRCVENGLPMARAANTGISAFILANGKIVNKSDLFVKIILQEEIPIKQNKTFYSQFGDIFAILISIIAIMWLLQVFIGKHNAR